MTEHEPRLRRPGEDESAPPDQRRSQDELNRTSRSTGGDAPAAASVQEREAVARDEDDLFEDDGDGGDGDDDADDADDDGDGAGDGADDGDGGEASRLGP